MYNMEEKGFMMGVAARCRVICWKGRRNPRLTHSGSREWVTVIESVSAGGVALPPMAINQGAGHYKEWYASITKKEVATFGYSPKEETDSILGMEWLQKNFKVYSAPVYVTLIKIYIN